MTYGDYMLAHEDYMMRNQIKYGAYSKNKNQAASNLNYANRIQDAGFVKNTCTDGDDDGKIGIGGAIVNLGEGILKGAVNGITGMFTDSNGKFSLGKTLTSVGVAAACIAFPALGAVACGIGAVAGGSQLIKGLKTVGEAQTDAEAKAAWENIGAGGATVVGCAVGAKASVGAMKGSSMAAVDDVLKNLDNGDDVMKALKGVDKSNIDDVTEALSSAGIKNIDEVNDAIGSFGKDTSALGALDDSLTGTKKWSETAKAFAKDAVSSTKNNAAKIKTKAASTLSTAKEVAEYKSLQKKYNKIDRKGALTDDELKIIKEFEVKDTLKSDEAAEILAKMDDNAFTKKKAEMQQAHADVKAAKAKIKELDKTKVPENKADADALLAQREAAEAALKEAQAKTPFGKLTGKVKTNLNPKEVSDTAKSIKDINIKDIAGKLSAEGQKIFTSLQNNPNIKAVISEFNYDDVMQVLQIVYAQGQTNQTV